MNDFNMLIPFDELFKKYDVHPQGVLHIGASTGQEAGEYWKHGIKLAIFIEAIPEVFDELKKNIDKYPFYIPMNACISDKDGEKVMFNVASNGGQSSSMLEFGTHAKQHPSVKFTHQVELETHRIDTLLTGPTSDLYAKMFDFLNIDLQGAELLALKGMGEYLHNFKWAYIEVNKRELYKGCPLVGEIDNYLKGFGFVRVETKWTNFGWGDGFYLKTT